MPTTATTKLSKNLSTPSRASANCPRWTEAAAGPIHFLAEPPGGPAAACTHRVRRQKRKIYLPRTELSTHPTLTGQKKRCRLAAPLSIALIITLPGADVANFRPADPVRKPPAATKKLPCPQYGVPTHSAPRHYRFPPRHTETLSAAKPAGLKEKRERREEKRERREERGERPVGRSTCSLRRAQFLFVSWHHRLPPTTGSPLASLLVALRPPPSVLCPLSSVLCPPSSPALPRAAAERDGTREE
jgi:hypothetical protein